MITKLITIMLVSVKTTKSYRDYKLDVLRAYLTIKARFMERKHLEGRMRGFEEGMDIA